MSSEVILEVGAEGGSLTVVGERDADGKWNFRFVRNELMLYESEEESGARDLYFEQSEYIRSIQDTLKRLDKYPWFNLYPLKVHPEFFDTILSEVRKRGGVEDENRWRVILKQEFKMETESKLREQGPEMINFEAMISHFGPKAISVLLRPKERKPDKDALQTINDKAAPDGVRIKVICGWLHNYRVFQGITGPQRIAISKAVLQWADSRDKAGKLSTLDALCLAHESLMKDCENAYGGERDFTSLASKALWLCYPNDVPLFDNFARQALWVFSKLESGIIPLTGKVTKYRQFVHIWKAFYDRYAGTITTIEMGNYEYPVRVFDRILWIVGRQGYKVVF